MAEKIYFQWQNEILRKTIYLRRDLKLQHFLLYYKEIDLWGEYKAKKIDDLSKEKAEFEESQKKAISEAYKSEQSLREYFKEDSIVGISEEKLKKYFQDPTAYNSIQTLQKYLKDPIQASLPGTDSKAGKNEMERFANLLVDLHKDFHQYFPQYEIEDDESRDRKEKNFVATLVSKWEEHQKGLKQKIAKKKNILDHPDTIDKKEKQRELDALKLTVLPWVETELDQLRKLVSAQNKLEKRKAEFAKREKENSEEETEILRNLDPLKQQIESGQAKQKEIEATIARLTNAPNLDDAFNYFSSSKNNIYDEIRRRLSESHVPVQKPIINRIVDTIRDTIGDTTQSFHDELSGIVQTWRDRENKAPEKNDPTGTLQWIRNQADDIRRANKKLDQVILALQDGSKSTKTDSTELINILGDSSEIGVRNVVISELDRLEDLYAAIVCTKKMIWEDMIKQERSKLESVLKEISKAKAVIKKDDLDERLERVQSALRITRDLYLSKYVPDQPETVTGKSVKEQEDVLKNQEEKLKKDIVLYLAEKERVRLEQLTSDQLLGEVFQRFWKEPERFPLWLQYMVIHFSGMRYASAHDSWYDPKALLLSLQTLDIQEGLKSKEGDQPKEAHYNVDTMTPEQILEALKSYKSQLPKWMWKEIVEVTDLRLTEVTDGNGDWENLTAEEQKERNSNLRLAEVTNANEDWEKLSPEEQARNANRDKRMAVYRAIMEKWKKNNLTGWRQEHDRANRLIVTRAVCNEVAEHIQHLRGYEGAAGLAEKPGWYMGAESKFYESKERPAGARPYFVKAKDRNDFEVGASILWLRFVHEVPDKWRVANPLETREGDGLIPESYLGRSIDSGGWAYKMGGPIVRTRNKPTTNNNNKKGSKGGKENQWLRWMHEATVVEVAETAETGDKDKVVLTFETNLPDEDRNVATIGLFKRYLSDLTRQQVEDSYNAAFVGFMPEAKLPADAASGLASDLEEMLDWNHILQREAVPAADLENYRNKYIRNRKPSKPTIEIIDIAEREKGKADLNLCEFAKWTDKLALEKKNMYKVRIWGDKKLEGLNVGTVGTSNFQAVGLYNKETGRGGVSNFLKIGRDDIDKLIAMQIEDEFLKKRDDWLKQKMSWLCKREGTIYFTKGGKGWETAQFIDWGTIALGGNLVQVEGEPEEIEFKVAGGKEKMLMAKLVGFSKLDWNRPLEELLAEGLVHRCFCVHKGKNIPRDTPQGIVYSPFFSPKYWDFTGREQPRAFYLPFKQLVKPDEKDYVGIAQKLNCK